MVAGRGSARKVDEGAGGCRRLTSEPRELQHGGWHRGSEPGKFDPEASEGGEASGLQRHADARADEPELRLDVGSLHRDARAEARPLADADDLVVEALADRPRPEHEVLVAQIRRNMTRIDVDMGDSLGSPATITATTQQTRSGAQIRVGGAAKVIQTKQLEHRL
jgi:hypothetical protein